MDRPSLEKEMNELERKLRDLQMRRYPLERRYEEEGYESLDLISIDEEIKEIQAKLHRALTRLEMLERQERGERI